MTNATATPNPTAGLGDLLRHAWDLVLKHPLPLAGPLVLLGLLTAGGGTGYGGASLTPWWLLPLAVLFALLAVVIGLAVLVAQILVWLLTLEASLLAARTGDAPRLGVAWENVWIHLAKLGESFSRAWALTEGHRVELVLALAAIIVTNIIVGMLVQWLPIIGAPLRGAVGGLAGALWAATLAVFYAKTA